MHLARANRIDWGALQEQNSDGRMRKKKKSIHPPPTHLCIFDRNDPVQASRRIIIEADIHSELTGRYPAPLGGLVDMKNVSFCGEY